MGTSQRLYVSGRFLDRLHQFRGFVACLIGLVKNNSFLQYGFFARVFMGTYFSGPHGDDHAKAIDCFKSVADYH
jgi:hypothetical protein